MGAGAGPVAQAELLRAAEPVEGTPLSVVERRLGAAGEADA